MKIVHCSDLHLGKRPIGSKKFSDTRYEDFFIAFEKLIDKIFILEVDVLIISGDIFDKKEINANILEKTEKLLKKLKKIKENLEIIAIEGNHDIINSEENSWLNYLKNRGYIKIYSYRKDFEIKNHFKIGDINFYPVGYPGFMIDKALEKLSEKLNKDEKNIVIVHTGISGNNNSLPGLVSTRTIDLFNGKVIYMAGGHIHSFMTYPKEKPYFFVSGSLEFTNIPNEKSDKKGAIYFDTDTREYEFIEIDARKRIRGNIFKYQNDIEEEFRKYIKDFSLTGEEILLIPIENKNNNYINIASLEEIAIKEGALKVYFNIKNNMFNGEKSNENDILNIEEIEKNIIKEWNILNKNENLIDNFSILKNLYLNEEKENFMELFDKILEDDENDNKKN